MAAATPPPCFKSEFAAFTMASTFLSVISPLTSLRTLLLLRFIIIISRELLNWNDDCNYKGD
jgi:hypothetical protein